jgi:electron transfer flavoprotein alpha subunit
MCWWPANAGAAARRRQIAGVAKVLHADARSLADGLAENVAAQVLAIAAATATSCSRPPPRQERRAARRRAAGRGQISDITKVDRADTFERPIYAGNAIATVQSPTRQGHHRAHHRLRRGRPRRQRRRRTLPPWPTAASSFVGRELTKSDRPELTAAKIIVSGGRGWAAARTSTKC